ncbi:hypothetical protein PTNB85_03506 [Pyrenophora teres f. teres]|nr:hypothetical protein PTNB85_03506 [Pyrenophora teres f. teres]
MSCQRPDCEWLKLKNLTGLKVPTLTANADLSGIGVIVGFSMSAYLTLLMLLLHYITIFDLGNTGNEHAAPVNSVDYGVLTWLRSHIISWRPSRRFNNAMEKSVLILGDLNVVTGIGILIAGYSQLKCGISAYHWQILVFISWFASFSFVSAMTFLQGYFRVNNTMRLIRIFFMVVFVCLLITALLPTGSKMWLNGYPDDTEGFYPSMNAVCFFTELRMPAKFHKGANFWTMIFSVLLIFVSHFHCGIRLFDPTAGTSRKYLRTIPGRKFKQVLYSMERRAGKSYSLHALVWKIVYLFTYAIFTFARAAYDILESMLAEIVWLAFAMAWGTIKVWLTRASATINFDGKNYTSNSISEENFWSFGQILPLVLFLLPLLSMAQTYLEDDAKEEEHMRAIPSPKITSRNEEPKSTTARALTDTTDANNAAFVHSDTWNSFNLDETKSTRLADLPPYPYLNFSSHSWYRDHLALLMFQILMAATTALYFLTSLGDVLGISSILRSRLFVIWGLGFIPLASLLHLTIWYLGALVVGTWPGPGATNWLMGNGERWRKKSKKSMLGRTVFWTCRIGLILGLLLFTFFMSMEIAGPQALWP